MNVDFDPIIEGAPSLEIETSLDTGVINEIIKSKENIFIHCPPEKSNIFKSFSLTQKLSNVIG